MAYVKAFNTQIVKFIKELGVLHPENSDLKNLKNTIFLTTRATPKTVMQVYRAHIYNPYNKYISTQDDKFFLDMDLSGTALNDLDYIKTIWKDTSESNKENIWKYLLVLNKLTEKNYNLS